MDLISAYHVSLAALVQPVMEYMYATFQDRLNDQTSSYDTISTSVQYFLKKSIKYIYL